MKPRILIVDDTELWRKILSELLEEKYLVDTAASFDEAIHFMRQEDYQVVITDIGLTEQETNTDGVELLKVVHRISPHTKTIAISGRAANANEEKFKEQYHTMVYLDRGDLSENIEIFIDWVERGIAESLEIKGGNVP